MGATPGRGPLSEQGWKLIGHSAAGVVMTAPAGTPAPTVQLAVDAAAKSEEAIADARRVLGANNLDSLISEAREQARSGRLDFPTALRRLAERKARP
jgi:hypothetical protein